MRGWGHGWGSRMAAASVPDDTTRMRGGKVGLVTITHFIGSCREADDTTKRACVAQSRKKPNRQPEAEGPVMSDAAGTVAAAESQDVGGGCPGGGTVAAAGPDGGGDQELARILGISRAFKASKALNLSAKLGLYSLLVQHPGGLAWSEIAARLGWQVRPLPPGPSPMHAARAVCTAGR